jgi:small multidrug resistance pump
VFYGEKPDLPAYLGMGLIIAGVAIIQMFSRLSSH